MRRPLLAAVALPLLILAGCQRLNYERDFTLDASTSQTFTIAAPRGDQKLTVTATSSKEPIIVFVVLAEDKAAGDAAAANRIQPKKALGGQENAKEISFEATIPSGKEFIVYVRMGKNARGTTDVKLSVKGH